MEDLSTFSSLMKTKYPDEKVTQAVYKDNPLAATMPKATDFYGDSMKCPLIYADSQGASADFATAQQNKGATKSINFLLTRQSYYSLADIKRELWLASENNEGAFIQAFSLVMDSALRTLKRDIGIQVYRDVGGSLGRINNTDMTLNTISLVMNSDVVNFEVGMRLRFCPASANGVVRNGSVTIGKVNRTATTAHLTINEDQLINAVPGISNLDYIARDGDFNNKMSGLADWLPSIVTSTPFFGVDRTGDVTRMAGLRYSGTRLPIEEALLNAINLSCREGATIDRIYLGFGHFANLEKALGAKVQYDTVTSTTGNIGFEGIKLRGPKGAVIVIPDINCPGNLAYGLQMDTWKIHSLNPFPHVFKEEDGLIVLRNQSSDSYEIRSGYYAQIRCDNPGMNIVVTLRTAEF